MLEISRPGEPAVSADVVGAIPLREFGYDHGYAGASPALAALTSLRADPRQAVEEDGIRCLVCGGVFRQLTNTHLRAHGTSAGEYKRYFGYNRGRPLMCHALARLYAERARRAGLAARIRRRPILAEPELRRRGGARTIALEEFLTRREARRREVLRRARVPSGTVA